jgi:metal-dependent amidase/aminoacylase/carboxypeptidase family protein
MDMNYYERALALKEETVAHRRWFHTNAEVGLNMPKGQAYVLAELEKLSPEQTDHILQIVRDIRSK